MSGPRCKVLVADDNADAAHTLALILKMSGYDVHLAMSGSEALAVARREQADAMFLDIGMPDMSGYEVAASVRREGSSDEYVRVDVMAGVSGLTRTTMTMKPIRCLFQPPTQQTCQSPKREPTVTAVGRRRNLVWNCMCFCGHHIHHFGAL